MKEGPIYFLVLNTKTNEADLEAIIQFNECLDEVANSSGESVLITVSSSPKFFSTGFDLNYFAKSHSNIYLCGAAMQSVLIKFLTINCPSLCLVNGHAIAGGVIMAACHDFRAI